MDKEKLPSIVFFPRKEDIEKVRGLGSVEFYDDEGWQESYREALASHTQILFNNISNKEKKYPDLPNVAKVKMKEKAIAKSHKPNQLLTNRTCPIVGSGKLDELYIKVTSTSIGSLKSEIERTTSEIKKANISKIESIASYDLSNSINIQSLKNKIKDNQPLKLKFFDFQNDQDNSKIYNAFIQTFKDNVTIIDKLKYSDSLDVYAIEVKSDSTLDEILEFPGIKDVAIFPEYKILKSEVKKAEKKLEDLLSPELGIDYPIVGLIDSGISSNNKYLQPWIYNKEILVIDSEQDNSHGTFIGGLLVYGSILNEYNPTTLPCKILDVVAIPRGGKISEEELIVIIENALKKYSNEVKIWNLSIGGGMCNDSISDFAIFLDEMQKKYSVKFVIAAGNLNDKLRAWEATGNENYDVISSPGDSVLGITVGSIAQKSSSGFVERECPSPFTRRGPGPNFIVKPDVVHYGGNCDVNGDFTNLGVISFDINGNLVEDIGTSFSTPIIAGILANIYQVLDDTNDKLLLSKSLLVNNSFIPIETLNPELDLFRYYGFGKLEKEIEHIVYCNESEVQMVLSAKIQEGSFIEIEDFPFPKSLMKNGKWVGEIKITLAYNPPLDSDYGQEYCRTNIDVSLGTYSINPETGEYVYNGGCVPLEKKWQDKYEKQQVENGFKWNPIKSYYKRIPRGISGDGWKLLVNCMGRYGVNYVEQEVLIVITIKDPNGGDIYSEIINELDNKAFIHQELAINNSIRLKN